MGRMKVTQIVPPREFAVGQARDVVLRDCARIELAPDEQITFVTGGGAEYDVARKSWGFYATPSTNGRLRSFGLRAALVKGPGDKYYVMLVDAARRSEFDAYCGREGHEVIAWLDDAASLAAIERAVPR
jgi:hypothetical protein